MITWALMVGLFVGLNMLSIPITVFVLLFLPLTPMIHTTLNPTSATLLQHRVHKLLNKVAIIWTEFLTLLLKVGELKERIIPAISFLVKLSLLLMETDTDRQQPDL